MRKHSMHTRCPATPQMLAPNPICSCLAICIDLEILWIAPGTAGWRLLENNLELCLINHSPLGLRHVGIVPGEVCK